MEDWKKKFKKKYDNNEFRTASYIYDFIDDNDVSAVHFSNGSVPA